MQAILDYETYGAIVAATPLLQKSPDEMALEIVNKLRELASTCEPQKGINTIYREINVKTLAEEIEGKPSPKMIGKILQELGLSKQRRANGYVLVWSDKQLRLLETALPRINFLK